MHAAPAPHVPRRARRVSVAAVAAAAVVSTCVVLPAAAATAAAPPPDLPRSYAVERVSEMTRTADAQLLALSGDGTSAAHLARRAEDDPQLVVTRLTDGASATVGISPAGTPVQAESVDLSATGDRVAFVALGDSAQQLGLPGTADPDLRSALMVRDRTAGATSWVPVPPLGVRASLLPLRGARLSADARRVLARIALRELPPYTSLNDPSGVLLATLAADGTPSVQVLRPEAFLLAGQTLSSAEPQVLDAALSADGAVAVVEVLLADVAHLLRFDAATGTRLAGDRVLPRSAAGTWAPRVDRTGRYAVVRTTAGTADLVVADLTGATPDRVLPATATAPFVSGDRPFGAGELPAATALSADSGTALFRRAPPSGPSR